MIKENINEYHFGRYSLKYNEIMHLASEVVSIPPKELHLLSLLVANFGRVISKNEIIDEVWHGGVVNDESLTRCVYSIRKLLGKEGRYIKTVYGKGYIFTAQVSIVDSVGYNSSELMASKRIVKTEHFHELPRLNNQSVRKLKGEANVTDLKQSLVMVERYLGVLICNESRMTNKIIHKIKDLIENVLADEPSNGKALVLMGVVESVAKRKHMAEYYFSHARNFSMDERFYFFYYSYHLYLNGDYNNLIKYIDSLNEDEEYGERVKLIKDSIYFESKANYANVNAMERKHEVKFIRQTKADREVREYRMNMFVSHTIKALSTISYIP